MCYAHEVPPCAIIRSIVRVVGLGFREAEDRSSIQLESLFIVQVWPSTCVGPIHD